MEPDTAFCQSFHSYLYRLLQTGYRHPHPACQNLKVDHSDYLKLLRKLRELPNVKKVFIRSGIRFDYLIYDNDRTFLRELCEHHVSGQLKVAPEHISDAVLEKMGKASGKDTAYADRHLLSFACRTPAHGNSQSDHLHHGYNL